MLNGWDVLAIFVIGFMVYTIIKQICLAVVSAKAVKQAGIFGKTQEEILDQVDSIVAKAIKDSQIAIFKKVVELDEKSEEKIVKLVDEESKKIGLVVKAIKKDVEAMQEVKKQVEDMGEAFGKLGTTFLGEGTDEPKKTTRKKKIKKDTDILDETVKSFDKLSKKTPVKKTSKSKKKSDDK